MIFYLELLGDTYKQRSKESKGTGDSGWGHPSDNCDCASVCPEIGSLSWTPLCEPQNALGCRREWDMSSKSLSWSSETP